MCEGHVPLLQWTDYKYLWRRNSRTVMIDVASNNFTERIWIPLEDYDYYGPIPTWQNCCVTATGMHYISGSTADCSS